jgi:hypothetical protein
MRRLAATVLIGAMALAMSAGVSGPAVAGGKHHGYGGYGHGYSGHGYRGYGYYGHGYWGPAVVVGVAGLFVGWMLHDAAHYAPPPRVVYVPAPRAVYVPASVGSAGPPARARPLPPGCLMIREYQTRLTVGGRQVEAYGDACLQADGSWRRLAPRLVPE